METTMPPINLSKERKHQVLSELSDEANKISTTFYTEPNFSSWKVSVEITLKEVFGENSTQLAAFKKLKFYSLSSFYPYEGNETAHQHTEAFKRDFETAKLFLKQFKNTIDKQTEVPLAVTKAYLPKIQWQGTQKELAELFVELHDKGWIDGINANLIADYFSHSNTIHQILKPHLDKQTNEKLYSEIRTKNFKSKFNQIKPNNRKKT